MIKVSITTQKGGTGKSTLTGFLANMLCFQRNVNVLIVDCDPPQSTISTILYSETALFETIKTKKKNKEPLEAEEVTWAKEFEKTLSQKSKKIHVISIEDPRIKGDFRKLDTFIKDYDVVLYDLPGSLENVKLLNEMLTFNYIFIPVEPDYYSGVKSTATAAALHILKERFQSTGTSTNCNIHLFFNKVNVSSVRHRKEMLKLYTTAGKKGFNFLTKPDGTPLFVDIRVDYQDNLTRSLIVNIYSKLRYTKVDMVLQEITKIIGYGTQEKENSQERH